MGPAKAELATSGQVGPTSRDTTHGSTVAPIAAEPGPKPVPPIATEHVASGTLPSAEGVG